ncbi:MAG: GNAT family N-acetyltransferase [Phycisphaerales bacterium]|nr:GNAT family N-acetyltransferase [Phycisphaerales bacterium]
MSAADIHHAGLSPTVALRDVQRADLDMLFEWQQNPEGCAMAFVKPRSRPAFDAAWDKVLTERENTASGLVAKLILSDQVPCGSIGTHSTNGELQVGYLIARPFWNQGIATRALALLLAQLPVRPLHARAAARNTASIKVLLKNGFRITGTKWGDETDRYLACEEIIFLLQ